jgi:UDP-glucose 4-epimerase
MAQPRLCFNANIKGTYNLLEAARINHVERVIFSSSAAVYGNHEETCTETDICAPQSPYGISKLIGEQLCQHYYQLFNLHSLCLRYFNVYNVHKYHAQKNVYARFKAAILNNEPITLFGDGTQTRDFTSSDEVVRANTILAQLPPHYLTSQPVNIASGHSQSLNDLIEQLKREMPESTSQIRYQPARMGDIKHSAANIQKYHHLQTIVS